MSVVTACDGIEGVRLFGKLGDEISVVLLDMTMPDQNGEQTLREMNVIRRDVPVILCSGYTKDDALGRFGETGLAGYLQKPFRRRDLLARVRAVMES